MRSTGIRPLIFLALPLACSFLFPAAYADDKPAEPKRFTHQVTGLFQPDREDDLRAVFEKLPQFKLVSIDYPGAEVVVEYDPSVVWPGEKPERFVELLDNRLRNASRGTFGVKPVRTIPLETLERIEIPVEGLDCKGCSYAAYLLVYQLPGVELANASFKDGKVSALIDPEKTDQGKLEAALKKGGVEVTKPAVSPSP